MMNLDDAAGLGKSETGLAVASTLRADATIQSTVINAGAIDHPDTGRRVLAFVTFGRVKMANLRARPQIAVTFRLGWQWATVEGRAELAGPDDPQGWLTDADQLRVLIRDIYRAAGGTHDDWDEFDRVMLDQRRCVVLISPTRVYSNQPESPAQQKN